LTAGALATQARILDDAIDSINFTGLINQFNQDVRPFLEDFGK
jgi:hypothetical protein